MTSGPTQGAVPDRGVLVVHAVADAGATMRANPRHESMRELFVEDGFLIRRGGVNVAGIQNVLDELQAAGDGRQPAIGLDLTASADPISVASALCGGAAEAGIDIDGVRARHDLWARLAGSPRRAAMLGHADFAVPDVPDADFAWRLAAARRLDEASDELCAAESSRLLTLMKVEGGRAAERAYVDALVGVATPVGLDGPARREQFWGSLPPDIARRGVAMDSVLSRGQRRRVPAERSWQGRPGIPVAAVYHEEADPTYLAYSGTMAPHHLRLRVLVPDHGNVAPAHGWPPVPSPGVLDVEVSGVISAGRAPWVANAVTALAHELPQTGMGPIRSFSVYVDGAGRSDMDPATQAAVHTGRVIAAHLVPEGAEVVVHDARELAGHPAMAWREQTSRPGGVGSGYPTTAPLPPGPHNRLPRPRSDGKGRGRGQ